MGDRIQFYTTNRFEDSTAVATSNSNDADVVLDNDNRSYWVSQSSSDGTTETLTLTLTDGVDIDHILLLGNNFKTGTVQYYDGSWNTAVTISSTSTDRLIDLGSVKSDVTEIRFNITHTETADNEKSCAIFAGVLLRFELQQNPRKVNPVIKTNIDTHYDTRNLANISRNGNDVFAVDLDFNNIGTDDTLDDFNNIVELARTRESFYLNLTGDTEQNRIPYTWNFIKKMVISKDIKIPLSAGCHTGGNNIKVSMIEVK